MSPVFWDDTKPPLDFKKKPMTAANTPEQQQPKEHCDHECVCLGYISGCTLGDIKNGNPCTHEKEICPYDTRTTHSSAGAQQQRIEQAIKELEQALETAYYEDNDAHIREALALLQAGDEK